MLVTLIFICFLLCCVRGRGRVVFWSWFLLLLPDSPPPCGRGAVPEHPGAATRTGGTDPARHSFPEMAQASAGIAAAGHPPWIPRSPPRAAPAGAWTPSAAACPAAARSLPPTVVTSPAGPISPGDSVRQ